MQLFKNIDLLSLDQKPELVQVAQAFSKQAAQDMDQTCCNHFRVLNTGQDFVWKHPLKGSFAARYWV